MLFSAVTAQEAAPRFKLVENALLHKLDIAGIYISHDDKLWFGTANGLASFDGNDVKVYPVNTDSVGELVPDRILAFAEDKTQNIWVYTAARKLACFSPITGKYTEVDFLKNDSLKALLWVPKLFFDKNGKLWLGTNRGFFIYDVQTAKYEHYNLKPEVPASWTNKYQNTVYDFGEDVHDPMKMWIGSYGLGIVCFDKTTKKISRKFITASADSILQDGFVTQIDVQDSTIWFGTWGVGMGKYDKAKGEYRMFPRNEKLYTDVYPHGHVIRGMVRKSADEYYVALGDSIPAVFNTATGRYRYINNEALQQTINRTAAVAKDKAGNLWLVKGGRLYTASPQYSIFTALPPPQKSMSLGTLNTLRKMIWDSAHQLYYAAMHQGGGICVYNKMLQYIKTISQPGERLLEYNASIVDFEMDAQGRLWTLGDHLYVYDSASQKMMLAADKYKSVPLFLQSFEAMAASADGNLIFLNNKRRLCFFNTRNFETEYVLLPPVKKPGVDFNSRRLLFDAVHSFVYACDGDAIFQYRIKEKKFNTIEVTDNSVLPKINVSTYALDEKGDLWIGSRGIYIFEPLSLRLLNILDAKNGLTDNVNINLLQGPPGYLFFFTPHGGNLYSTADSTFVHFDLSNGAPADFPSGYSFANNRLFFAPGAGASNAYADLPSLLSLKKTVQPYLSAIRFTNKNFIPDTLPQYLSELQLQHDENNITLSFSATEFAFPDKIEYAYWLQGLEKDWTLCDYANRSITYTNLKPNDYVFHVKARLLGGRWTEMQHPLYITIVPAFWQTAWFKILMAFLAVALLYFFLQKRLKNERKKVSLHQQHQSQLAELEADALRAQMNPHFIFNCLNSIKALIQHGKNETAVSYLITFSKLIRTLFQNADKREISLHEELETCKLYTQLEALRFGERIRFAFDVDNTLDLKDIFVPALILQPFIENAIWHGLVPKEEGGRLTVSVLQKNGTIQCIVDDEGIGRELSKQFKDESLTAHQSKGIALTQNRLKLDRILHHRDDAVAVMDKMDNDGKAAGTKVVLSFKAEKE